MHRTGSATPGPGDEARIPLNRAAKDGASFSACGGIPATKNVNGAQGCRTTGKIS